jgi:hypothetical protein
MEPSAVVELEGEAKKAYLKALSSALHVLGREVYSKKMLSLELSNYYTSLGDILSIAQLDTGLRDEDLTVSTISGMPVLSKLLDIQHDQNKAKKIQEETPALEKIAENYVSAFFRFDLQYLESLQDQFQRSYYFQQVQNSKKFETRITTKQEDDHLPGMNRYVIEYQHYPLSLMSPLILHVEMVKQKRLLPLKEKIPLETITQCAEQEVEFIYLCLAQKSELFPTVIRQYKSVFYFSGKQSADTEMERIVSANPGSTILKVTVDGIENMDHVLAETRKELKNSDKQDANGTRELIYVCSEEIRDQVMESTLRQGTIAQILTN